MTMLMAWTSKYDLHIHCVLHLNKNDNNTRGHIGTELENKAETVLIISKNKQDANISEVRPMHMRDKEFRAGHSTLTITLCLSLMSVITSLLSSPKTSRSPLCLTMFIRWYFKDFSKSTPQRYVDLVKALGEAYAEEGYKRGDNAVKEMLKIFNERKLITRKKTLPLSPNSVSVQVSLRV